jgi:signal transduction histidine kinase/ActR/RegA family two-component response regulator
MLNMGSQIRRTYIPIFSNGVYKGHFWKIEDITEERKLEESLFAAKEEAEKANRTKSEFLSKMSHELRTPLNAILGFAQILEYDTEEPLTFEQNQKVQEILQAGRHLLNLINEVLDLSRIESGHTAFQFEHAVFQELLEQSLALVKKHADEMNVSIEIIDLPEVPIILNVDVTRFQQILINLLTNAIKYNRQNGSISLAALIKDQYVTLTVKDTGQGIPAHDLPYIFEPFFRGSHVKSIIEGTGVGLSIAKMMTEKMGGEMSVSSEPGRGSIFTVTFPYTEMANFKRTKEMKKETYHFSSRKVLYIEDNASNTALMHQVLKNIQGIQLVTSRTAGEGILLAKSLLPDIILLDLHIPGMNGLDVFHILKKTGSTGAIPVIAVSAAAMESDIERALSAGFADYVTKPIDINQVIEVLFKHLESSFVSS